MKRNSGFQKLAEHIRGELLLPGSSEFEEASRIWNSRLERKAAAVVRCHDAGDVAAAIDFSRERSLPLTVKSGGHSYAGLGVCEDALVIDLSRLKMIDVDPQKRRARVGAGVRWREFDERVIAHGLASTGGTVSTVGVAGFTLGGGTGYLSRKYGMALDNLVSAKVVTADGQIVRASETENSDLFWGIRGGAGNFGVAVEFEFQLHRTDPEMLAGQVIYRFEDARRVLQVYRDVMPEAPDELVCYPCFIRIPTIPDFPEDLHGETAICLILAFAEEILQGEEVVLPLRNIADPIVDSIGPQSYLAVQKSLDSGVPEGQRWYSRACYLDELSDRAIETALEYSRHIHGVWTFAYFEPLGGAIGRVDPKATAFPHRDRPYSFHILAGWTDSEEDGRVMEWVRSFHDAMSQFSRPGVYVNLLSEDESERIIEAFGENYERLRELKRKWDPTNLFRQNQNIEP